MTLGDDVAQSTGSTEPKWGWPTPLPWSTGQGLTYFQKLFHTRVKRGRWRWSVMPEIDDA
jgi:hypothetical protein